MLETWEFWWISNTLSVLFQQFLFDKLALRGFNWMAGENPWPRGGNHYCNPEAPTALNSLLHFRLGFSVFVCWKYLSRMDERCFLEKVSVFWRPSNRVRGQSEPRDPLEKATVKCSMSRLPSSYDELWSFNPWGQYSLGSLDDASNCWGKSIEAALTWLCT